jgi:hypothetical protein
MIPGPPDLFLLRRSVESVRVVHQDSAVQDIVAERREEIHELPVVQHPFDVGVWEVGAPQDALRGRLDQLAGERDRADLIMYMLQVFK